MARFFVGQRVRVAWVTNTEFSHEVGKEGIVEEIREGFFRTLYSLNNSPFVLIGARTFGFMEDQLEPIIPEGMQPSEFSFHELMDNLKEKQDVPSLHA